MRRAQVSDAPETPDGVEITDIAIIEGDLAPHDDGTEPAGDPPVQLVPGLTLERLPWDQFEPYMDAAESRGHNFQPTRQFGQRYAFVRRGAPGPIYEWDSDSLIQDAVMLSRMVRDNAHDGSYAVRVISGQHRDHDRQIVPVDRWHAWHVSDDRARTWLSQSEAGDLARLLEPFRAKNRWSLRVMNALWLAEYAARAGSVVPAVIWTVSATEALLNTDRYGARRQFVQRCRGLAHELQIDGVTDDLTDRFYTARSQSVHGAALTGADDHPQMLSDLGVVLTLVRAALRHCIENAEFRATFDRDDYVRTRFPVSTR